MDRSLLCCSNIWHVRAFSALCLNNPFSSHAGVFGDSVGIVHIGCGAWCCWFWWVWVGRNSRHDHANPLRNTVWSWRTIQMYHCFSCHCPGEEFCFIFSKARLSTQLLLVISHGGNLSSPRSCNFYGLRVMQRITAKLSSFSSYTGKQSSASSVMHLCFFPHPMRFMSKDLLVKSAALQALCFSTGRTRYV